MRLLRGLVILTMFQVLLVAAVRADDLPLSKILPQFFVDGITLQANGHGAHFSDQGAALDVMERLNTAIASQFATYPLGSSSGAFTFELDETGAYVPTSESFGPIFAERPETLGKGKVNLGVTSLFYQFDKLEGLDFETGDIVFNLVHEDGNGDGSSLQDFWEGDLIESRVFLDLKLNTNIVFANFGVTDRFDLGIAIPWVRAELNSTVRSTVLPLATGAGTHQFANGGLVRDDESGGVANGIGDVVVRGKFNFRKGLGGAFDIRLPTGDEENLLGSGATQVKLLLIAQSEKYDIFYGGLYPHLNLGYTYSTGGYTQQFDDPAVDELLIEPSDEINLAVGFDVGLGRRITLAVDVIGRMLLGADRISLGEEDFLYTSLGASGPVLSEARPTLVTTEGDLILLYGTLGVKIDLGRGVLLTLSGISPILRDRGLEDEFVGSFGLDFTF